MAKIIVGRDQREKATQIFMSAKNITTYAYSNDGNVNKIQIYLLDYKGENWLLKLWDKFPNAMLKDMEGGKYRLNITHSKWYDFEN